MSHPDKQVPLINKKLAYVSEITEFGKILEPTETSKHLEIVHLEVNLEILGQTKSTLYY